MVGRLVEVKQLDHIWGLQLHIERHHHTTRIMLQGSREAVKTNNIAHEKYNSYLQYTI